MVWQSLIALGLGLGLGVLIAVLTAPRRSRPQANPWAQRTTRDWDQEPYGSGLDGVSVHRRWPDDHDEAGR